MKCDAPAEITFYAVPDDQAAAVIDWLNRWQLGEHDQPRQDHTAVTVGTAYGDPDAGLGIGVDGGAELCTQAPGAAWRMSQDSTCEYDGEVWTHVPGWPLRRTQGDRNGAETFSAAQIREAVDTDSAEDLLGSAYTAELSRLATLHGGRVLTAGTDHDRPR